MQETEQTVRNENDLQMIKELRLMHDFSCKNAEDIVNPLLAEEVRYLKETEGGRGRMCKLLEEMRAEAVAEAAAKARKEGKAEGKLEGNHEKAVSMALKMLERGRDSIEEISEMTDLALEEVRELSKKQTA